MELPRDGICSMRRRISTSRARVSLSALTCARGRASRADDALARTPEHARARVRSLRADGRGSGRRVCARECVMRARAMRIDR